jgi:acyl carrier protein
LWEGRSALYNKGDNLPAASLPDRHAAEGRDKTMDTSSGDIRDTVFGMLRAKLEKPVVLTDATNIVNEVGLDSVAVMDFVMEIEDRLDISVPLDRIAEVETLGDLVATVRALKGAQ